MGQILDRAGMNEDYKKICLIIFTVFSLIFLAGFQISVINNFTWGFNVFLILILFLILTKNIYSAIFLGWFGGFLIDTVHFSIFGATSLILLSVTAFLIIFQKRALLTLKKENVLIISVLAVFFYRFLELAINNLYMGGKEKFSFYFLNSGIAIELLLTVAIMLIIFFAFGKKYLN